MGKHKDKQLVKLTRRRKAYDGSTKETQDAMKRPGSMNPRKQG